MTRKELNIILLLTFSMGLLPFQTMADSVNDQNVTLSWPLGNGNEDNTSAIVSREGLFSVASFNHGTLKVTTQRSAGTSRQTLYNPSENTGAPTDGDNLSFTMKAKRGVVFQPKSFSFESSRWGTSGGKFDVVAIVGNTERVLAKGINPDNGNMGNYTSCSYDLSPIAVGEDVLVLKIRVYGLATNKECGFGNVVVTGTVSGTPAAVPSYNMSLSINMEGAGNISCNPAGDVFDEGTQITVSATENFGFHFKHWADENGNAVSSENPYTFTISENTTLIATYTRNNTCPLYLNIVGGANENLIQFEPEGHLVEGVHWYEEGTDVRLTAQNNKILTFVGWEDNNTNMERIVRMSNEQIITANFSAVDYIVGWDLYYDQPASSRVADYQSDTENAGMLTLTNGSSSSGWMARGITNGLENGRPGARIWKNLAEGWYFQISFSSLGYSNLKLSNGLCVGYNTYKTHNVEYSLDGSIWTKLGEFNLKTGWTDEEFCLPAECNHKQRVYIRWVGDRNSGLVGSPSDYDGLAIGDIFITAETDGAADEVPRLVSSNPTQNGIDASASGAVVLNFDKKVTAGSGEAELNGEKIAPVISGKSAVFNYRGLKYATRYTFRMPEGVLLSRSGKKVAAASIAFTTMERRQPEPRLYDAVVAQDGSGDYTSVQDAVNAAPTYRGTPWLIFLKNGRYKEHVSIPANKPYLHFIGQDRDKTVILDDKLSGGDNNVGIDGGCTVLVKANNIFFENLTLENQYGHEKQAGPQALALDTEGDRIAMNNVALLSYQDTWITTPISKNRHYIKNSLIEGAVDFIYNSGIVYFDGDTLEINRPSGGYIVAPSHLADVKWGYVFQNSIIRAHKGTHVTDVWLGRPWHNQPKTVFINLQTFVNLPAKGWYNTMGGLPALWAEYNTVDKNGNPIDLSMRESYYYVCDDNGKVVDEVFNVKNTLTAEEAAQYTIRNVMGGDDNWQPDLLCEACDAPVVESQSGELHWQAVPYAICYVVTCNGKIVDFVTGTSCAVPEGECYVQAVNEYGGLSAKGFAKSTAGMDDVNTHGEGSPIKIYDLEGRRQQTLSKGVNIIRQRNGIAVKVTKQ